MFVQTMPGGMERVELVDGGGLAPLRYSALEASDCGALPCRLDTPAGAVLLREQPGCSADRDVIMTLSPSDLASGCPNSYLWSDVVEAGGLTAYLGKSGVDIRVGAVCRNRPWKPC